MSDHRRDDFSERLIDLCSDHALGLHEPSDLHELDRLDPDSAAREAFDAIAAEMDVAYADLDPLEAPAGLEERLLASVPELASSDEPSTPGLRLTGDPVPVGSVRVQSPRSVWFPWLVAAACVAVTGVVLLRPTTKPAPLSPAAQRDALIASADPDSLVRYSWTPTPDPAVVGDVQGSLVWDDASQKGYMTISGLEVNDPSTSQYQLWIFDATRPQGALPQFADASGGGLLSQMPIDGGVFNISSTGEVVIPIDAKLRVKQGVAFAVTVEPPGGVVVSDRSRVPLLALPPQG